MNYWKQRELLMSEILKRDLFELENKYCDRLPMKAKVKTSINVTELNSYNVYGW